MIFIFIPTKACREPAPSIYRPNAMQLALDTPWTTLT